MTTNPDLSARLARAAARPADTGAALLALAALAPAEALAWLVGNESTARALTPAELGPVLERVAGAPGAAQVLARFADVAADPVRDALLAQAPEERDLAVVDAALAAAPDHAGLLRLAADLAVARGDASAHTRLTRLGRADNAAATVRHVWRQREKLPAPDAPVARIALLSSFTIDPLLPYVDLECRALGLQPRLYVAPFNSWTQEVVGTTTELRRFDPEVAFLSVALDDLAPELAGAPDAAALDAAGDTAVERVLAVARRFAADFTGTLVIHGFTTVWPDPLGILGGRSGVSRAAWVAGLNARLAEGVRGLPRVYVLDLHDVLLRRAGGAIDNPKMRHLGAMRLGEGTLADVARGYARYIAPVKGLARKCVVVDLDNTLWGGVVGEDGPHGIRLGDTSPGSEHVELQRYLKTLADRGILLAVNSKNNAEDALEVIRGHEAMVLREAAFSALQINWRPKPENMQAIAEELGIGLDSLVFVDDNPEEREMMRQVLPQVLTVDLPADPARYRAALEALPQLETLTVTAEDRSRVDQYRSKREREGLREATASLDDYLRSLGIETEIGPPGDADLPRVHQLFQRTNQFNLTTRRYGAGELAALAHDPAARLYVLRARDRFGDHGLVAAALARCDAREWTVDSLLMSCRVIGYGIETALIARVCREARAAGAGALVGEYIPTKKNVPAKDFYERHGFTPDGPRWRRTLDDGGVARPAWVTERDSHGA